MRVKGLDGKSHSWNLGDYVGKIHQNASSLHKRVRIFFKERYPAAQILEEVYLPGENLYLDFYLPVFKLACECQGAQHDKYTAFFHTNKMGFIKAQSRDRRKADWCRLNEIWLVYFLPTEKSTDWDKILNKTI
jgi:hypothetical protein